MSPRTGGSEVLSSCHTKPHGDFRRHGGCVRRATDSISSKVFACHNDLKPLPRSIVRAFSECIEGAMPQFCSKFQAEISHRLAHRLHIGVRWGNERTRKMRMKSLLVGSMLAATLAGCATGLPADMTVAEYCANPEQASEDVCRLKVEIDGNATALAETNLSLGEARQMADSAIAAANAAQASADAAQSRADAAFYLAEKDLDCETTTVQQSNIGTCEPGYTVMGCVQTRYTHRAGGLSFLRELNNEQCRFNSQVLEMQVRCCRAAADGAGDAS